MAAGLVEGPQQRSLVLAGAPSCREAHPRVPTLARGSEGLRKQEQGLGSKHGDMVSLSFGSLPWKMGISQAHRDCQ